jgi:hypothetical protein
MQFDPEEDLSSSILRECGTVCLLTIGRPQPIQVTHNLEGMNGVITRYAQQARRRTLSQGSAKVWCGLDEYSNL